MKSVKRHVWNKIIDQSLHGVYDQVEHKTFHQVNSQVGDRDVGHVSNLVIGQVSYQAARQLREVA